MAAVSGEAAKPASAAVSISRRPDLLSNAQRRQIERVLKRVGGNKTEAARLLGISRRALYRWLERLELSAAQVSGGRPSGRGRRRSRPAVCRR